jgi:hypothetical protein
MFTKSTIALAIIVGITSGALAATKEQHQSRSWEVYNSRGKVIGADPDPLVRMDLRRDHGTTE